MLKKPSPIFIFPFALLALLVGIIAGWQRASWSIPVSNIAADHGALMTGSFIGTLICLERSIVHPCKWWRWLPVINGSSAILFLIHEPRLAYALLIAGSAGLLILMCYYFRLSVSLSNILLVMGAFAWLTGNLVLFNQYAYPSALKWWILFLLWTVLGERLELSRMLPVSDTKKWTLYLILCANIAGVFLPFHWSGNELFAASLLAIAIWLLAFDMSRRSLKYPGQHRYIATWLVTGYGWLAVTAAWMIFRPDAPFAYDAVIHSFFLGFVFAMIFGHVPIIFPGIFKINISLYHPSFFLIFYLFQSALILRIAGDAAGRVEWRKWGILFNGIFLLVFFAANIILIVNRLKQKRNDNTGR